MVTEEIRSAKGVIRLEDWADINIPNLNLSLSDVQVGTVALQLLNLIELEDYDRLPPVSVQKFVYSTIKANEL